MLNNTLFRIAAIAATAITSQTFTQEIILESPVIKLIDGISIGIDGQRIGFMLQVRRAVKNILGDTGAGNYKFKDQMLGVRQLAEVEQKAKESNDAAALALLHDLLIKAKDDFLKSVSSFMTTARGTKQQMLMLIEESCYKRKRFDSILLSWGSATEGTEEAQFQKDIYDFQRFDTFCTDLINFLEDLMRSCPKACAQFQELLKQK